MHIRLLFTFLCVFSASSFAATPPKLWTSVDNLGRSKSSCDVAIYSAMQTSGARGLDQNASGVRGVLKNSQIFITCIATSNSTSTRVLTVASHDNKEGRQVRNYILNRM